MKNIARLMVLILVAIMVLTACGKKEEVVVANVNGESILKSEFVKQYNDEKKMYGITEEAEKDPTMAEDIKKFKLDVLDNMVSVKITHQKANEAGFKLDESYDAKAEEFIENMVKEVTGAMEGEAKNLKDKENRDFDKEARDYVNNYITQYGWTMDEYVKIIAEQIFVDEFVASIVKDTKVNEEEIKAYYDEELANQKEFGSAESAIKIYQNEQARIKYITVELSNEHIQEYQSLIQANKMEEAEEFSKGKLIEIKPKADEIYSKIEEGQDFDELLEEYNPDVWVDEMEEGYLLERNDPYLKDFEEVSFKLKVNEVSDIVETPYGYFIIKAYEFLDEKTFTFDEKRVEIEEFVYNTKKDKKADEIFSKWMKEAKIEIFEDNI